VWRRLGAEILVVEYLDRLIPGMDGDVAKNYLRILKKQGMKFKLGHKVKSARANANGVKVEIEPSGGGESETENCDVVLVAIGRRPFTEGLGLEAVGVRKDNQGRISTDKFYQTNIEGIYAIGDVIDGPMLAHKAEDEGIAVAEILAGQKGHVNYDVIPAVIYTYPEVASVGKTEEELKEAGIAYSSGKFPFAANGRAKVNRQTEGYVKILADKHTDRILGVHIIGPDAGNMIAEAAVIMEFGGSAEDLARTCHAHPTLTEAVREAALAVDNRALHM
jgi:dihydrolipoamide dehydrogenase